MYKRQAGYGKVTTDERGQPRGMMGICMDVTERKLLEQIREQAVADLQRTVSFNETFTGILSHDLRVPLGAITMSAHVALERDEGGGGSSSPSPAS